MATELRWALAPLNRITRLAESGQFEEVVRSLRERPYGQLQGSPELALRFATALAHVGSSLEAHHWAVIALAGARDRGDRPMELRALNVCGGIAFESGEIEKARTSFMEARSAALDAGDFVTVGRCANNLGIIANLRGDFEAAVGDYTNAIAAYQRAQQLRGVVESHHNLGITYREQRKFDEALTAADRAVHEAVTIDDTSLLAKVVAGRAEIRAAAGDPILARKEAEQAVATHRALGDTVCEAEDLRILALAIAASGETAEAETAFRDVTVRARQLERPLLLASAQRDLARLLMDRGCVEDAASIARTALDEFTRMGAVVEVRRLEALIASAERSNEAESSSNGTENNANID